jgi:hypothetical protein
MKKDNFWLNFDLTFEAQNTSIIYISQIKFKDNKLYRVITEKNTKGQVDIKNIPNYVKCILFLKFAKVKKKKLGYLKGKK